MNWFTLLKQPELRTGSKVTTNLGIDSKEEEDDCERKLREYANKLGNRSFVDEGIPEEVHCKTLKIINKALNSKEFKSVNEFAGSVKEKNGIIWFIACELYIARKRSNEDKFNVYFFLQVYTEHSPIPHPKYSEIFLYNETEYGETLDKDNIDYAKVKEVDFR